MSARFRWNQSSMDLLTYAESQLLACLNCRYSTEYVSLRNPENKLWTLRMDAQLPVSSEVNNTNGKPTPLVMIHGLGGGVALWVLNLDALSKHRPLYAMDILGFGKSSRPSFSSNPSVAEIEWVDSIEEWRISMGLGQFHLLGHSLGGFLAASYALRFPNQVKHLILVEPWGMAAKPPGFDNLPRPLWIRAVTALVRQFDPLAGLRVAGPWGAGLIRRVRPDLGRRFASPRAAAEIVYDYIHQCNIRSPASGESAFRTLADAGWARSPMINRIGRISSRIPVSVIYGSRSWMDSRTGELMSEKCREGNGARVQNHVLPQAGHHVYADQAKRFNDLVNEILLQDDAGQ